MKTKNSKRFGLFCLLMLLVVGVQAQPTTWKYPKVENGNTIVLRDAVGGIKSDALLTAAQKAYLMDQSNRPIYNDMSEYHKVSAKLQVASTDASASSSLEDAYSKCKSYSTGAAAGSWRLPTQRESMLIWMFKSKLTACGSITTASDIFWSSTESSVVPNLFWAINFSNGNNFLTNKVSTRYVRCVRDI